MVKVHFDYILFIEQVLNIYIYIHYSTSYTPHICTQLAHISFHNPRETEITDRDYRQRERRERKKGR